MKNKKWIISLIICCLLGSLVYSEPVFSQMNTAPRKAVQIKPSTRKVGKGGQTGGLLQTLLPHALPSNQLQSTTTQDSLGSSGTTDNLPETTTSSSSPIVSSGALPTLWNPLNPVSPNYQKATPVLNQGIQNICWSFTGTDTIATSSLSQLGTTPSLSPVYYDYLSADAFTDTINPLAIMLNNGLRQLSTDGNTLDYVPMMSVQGYDPVTAASLPQPQPVATAKDQKMSQIAFNQLTKANVHVSDSYKLNGFAPNQLPASSSAIMNRVNQIKQLVYQYGAVQFGLEAEISLDSPYYDSQNNASYVPYSAATAGSELVTTYDNQEYLNQDHELQIVGYDDNYSANNFTQSPGMNGAFVVKNTWGTSFGIGGYFYLSYADIYVAGSEIYADEVATTQSGEKTYSATNISPEASGYYYQLSESSKIVNTIFANTYTSQTVGTNQVEQLNSISAYMDQAGVSVELLYKTGTANSGTYTQLGTYTFTDAGYQTIPLSNAISLPNNTTYTVAIQILSLPSSCSTLNVPVQCKSDGSTGLYPVMITGNSWSKYSGSWTNLSSTERANLYLGANTDVVVNGSMSNTNNSIPKIKFVTLPILHSGMPFRDSETSQFKNDIAWIYDVGVTTGYSSTKYGGKDSVLRGQMAAFLYRMVASPTFTPTSTQIKQIKDISAFQKEILWLISTGVSTGTSATTYSPNASVTRGQMAAFLHRYAIAMGKTSANGQYSSNFKDVNQFSNDIGWLKTMGITTGTSPTTYSPNAPVTREQMAAFLHRFYVKFSS